MARKFFIRPAIQELIDLLRFRSSFGRPCYIRRDTRYAALIVPELRNGTNGPYAYIRTFQRATIDEAIDRGFVTLGPALIDVPACSGDRNHWATDIGHMGRTIQLADGAK
jgi:hypothetical protein